MCFHHLKKITKLLNNRIYCQCVLMVRYLFRLISIFVFLNDKLLLKKEQKFYNKDLFPSQLKLEIVGSSASG